MTSQVFFGPLTCRVMQGAKWIDHYPDTQAWADKFEQLLSFAQSQSIFDEYLARLQGANRQRDAALAEIRVAQFLSSKGYKPQRETWRPNGGPSSDAEFVIQGARGTCTVVEVKHPDWQGELTYNNNQVRAGGTKQPKHIDGETRAVFGWEKISSSIDKAYKKFNEQRPNLLVVSDDLFIPLAALPDPSAGLALYRKVPLKTGNPKRLRPGYFTGSEYENLGGVGRSGVADNGDKGVYYGMELYVNAFALPSTRLPRDVVKTFKGIRLWNDPTKPNAPSAEREHKWQGDNDRLDRDRILNVLEAKHDALRSL